MRLCFTLLVATTLLALASPASAEKPFHGGAMSSKAEALYRSGLTAYNAQDYARATRDLQAAMAIDRHRNILFALAQSLRLSGDCWSANGLYHRFVASSPAEEQVEAAKLLIDECTEVLRREHEREQERGPQEAPADESTGDETEKRTTAGEEKIASPPQVTNTLTAQRWYDDTLGLTLASAGVLSLAAGTGFALSSQSAASRAERSRNYADFDALADTSERHRVIAIATTVAGTSLLVGGIIKLLVSSSANRETSQLSLHVSERQRTIGIQGRF